VSGLRAGGWQGDERLVELGFYGSAVKYDWLVPLMLHRAGDEQQLDYGGQRAVDPAERYRERGLALLELTRWHARARRLVHDDPSLVSASLAGPGGS
jgi:hypothetical protein